MNSKYITSPFSSDLLTSKTALITGAGKGIGRACALSLAACGASVVAVARTKSDLDTLQEEAGKLITPCQADASSPDFMDKIDSLEKLDILVNNLGTNIPQPFIEVDADSFEKMLDLNIRTIFRITQFAVRKMLSSNSQGSIVNITSQMGHIGAPCRTVYCTTKHAIEGLTKALALELAPKGIRVNSVAPTFIETPMTAPMFKDESFKQSVLDKIPLGRMGNVQDVSNAIVYLASEAADLVTGTSLKVDGGWTAQ